jgi:DHA1 family bicyclomycin/chloramphenicol resistance-like MFS transporter
VVRDIYSGARASRELSVMGAITAFAPIVAPTIGGVLQVLFGWRAIFVVLMIFAAVAAAVAARLLPETLHTRASGPFSLRTMAGLYRSVIVHRGFLANLGIMTTSFIGLFAWVSGAPVVMQGVRYGLSPVVFGITFAMGAAGYMTGTFIGSRIVMRLGIDRMMGIGAFTMAVGGLIMAAVVALDLANVVWFVGAMTIYLAGLGLALPSSMAGALTPFPDRAGTASSLMGFVQQTGAAIAAGGIGLYLGSSAWPVAAVVATMGCVALLIWFLTRRVRAADGSL